MTDPIDVLIVGAGPTGSVLAIDLARRGLRIRIIEKNAHSFPGSRAKGIQPRTLEMLYDLGALDHIMAAGTLYPALGVHLGPVTLPRKMYKNTDPTEDVPYPNTLLIPQYKTDALLHERLSALGVAVEFNSQLMTFNQDSTLVHAKVSGPKGDESIDCKYLVGADGGASAVRQSLGIEFPGTTDEADRMIIVDCKVEGLSRKYWHAWPGRKGRFTVACPLPGGDLFQWMIRLEPDENPKLDEASLNERVQRHTKSKKLRLHDIRWTSVFRPNIRLADHYRKDRVFIAGDAAHVHTPMGAQGLNTGVQDAYNLGWKIAQVIHGAPDGLLETYEAERQPIAASVLGRSTRKYEAAATRDPESVTRGKDEQQLLLTYRAGPLGSEGADSTSTLKVGDRAPDATLQDESGANVRLFELYKGPHFTALAYGPEAARGLAQMSWPERGATLSRVVINSTPEGQQGIALKDAAQSFKRIYGVDQDTIILIRPDGYIGHIATRDRLRTVGKAAFMFTPI